MSMTIFKDSKPVILIDRHIGEDPIYGKGITGSDFVRELSRIESGNYAECEVWVNSIGGSVLDAWDIYNAIVKSNVNVTTRNVGMAASSAGWIMQAGKKRICNYYALLMMHNSSGGDDKALNAINGSITSMLAARCNRSEEWIKNKMNEETWINAEDSLKHGFYDEIDYECGVEVKEAYDNKTPIALYNKLKLVVNKLVEQPKKDKKMKKVMNALSLNEDASEESVLAEIKKLNDTINGLQASVKEKEDALKKIQDEKDSAEKKKAAEEVVNKAAEEGRIEKDAVAEFVKLALVDLEGVKNTLSKLPVKSTANRIPLPEGKEEGRSTWNYSDWEKKDPTGLTNMYKNNRAAYDLLLNKWLETKNIKG